MVMASKAPERTPPCADRPGTTPGRPTTSRVAVALLKWPPTPAAGTVVGALLIILGGVVDVSGAALPGTLVAAGGFALILKYRVLPAYRDRSK